jgi:hypothetical protein
LSAFGAQLVDDADADAALVTLSGGASGISIFKAALMTGVDSVRKLMGLDADDSPFLSSLTLGRSGAAGSAVFRNSTPAPRTVIGFNGLSIAGVYLGGNSRIVSYPDANPEASATAFDIGFSRFTAGVWEINNGVAGTFRDLKLRNAIQAPGIGTTVTPAANGDLIFEATSNTSVTVKLKGSDGVVRSAILTLS